MKAIIKEFTFRPLNKTTWSAFEELFGERGACGGCWCMTWRLHSADYERLKGANNKKLIRRLAIANKPIGVIGFEGTKPVGWCSVAPREDFIRLENSRVLKRVDDKKLWSIVCLFIIKPYRRNGLSVELIKSAVDYAIQNGAGVVEAYPVIPKQESMPDVFAFTGIHSAYIKAGFKEIARRSETRPIMRFDLSTTQ